MGASLPAGWRAGTRIRIRIRIRIRMHTVQPMAGQPGTLHACQRAPACRESGMGRQGVCVFERVHRLGSGEA